MNTTEYVKKAMRTLNDLGVRDNLAHAAMLIGSEAGEVVTLIKRNFAYGKPLEVEKLKDELGDLMWGIALTCHVTGLTLDEIMAANIAKLEARYPNLCFDQHRAINPDKEAEAIAQSKV